MAISKKTKKNNKYLSRKQFGGKDCKFPDIWENEDTCVNECPSGKVSKYKSSKFICDNLGGSNGMRFTDLSDANEGRGSPGVYYGPISSGSLPHGKGLMIYDNPSTIYYGEWVNGIPKTGIMITKHWSFEGEFNQNEFTQGRLVLFSDKTIREGTFNNGEMNGKCKATLANGTIIEGEFRHDKFKGNGTITTGKIVHNYPRDEHLFLTPKEYNISQFIIQQPDSKRERHSITLLIMLHGADIANSRCRYDPSKTVRLVSPIKTGSSHVIYYDDDADFIIDAYQIARNVFHLAENQKASSLQKLQKTIELFNLKSGPDYPVFPSDSLFNPLIDHLYSLRGEVIPYAGIYVIYDSKNDANPFDTFPERIRYDFSEAKKLTLDNDEILRSKLINMYMNKGYGIINIIDLSCRSRRQGTLPENIADLYSCRYTTADLSLPEELPIL